MADVRKSALGIGPKKPELEINKPEPRRFWRQPRNLWWLYLIAMLGSMWLWEAAQRSAGVQIPYSEFLQHLNAHEIKEATLGDQIVSGTLTVTDPRTHRPREFVTERPNDDALAQSLAAHGVKFSAARQSPWLVGLLLNWVLPFGAMFLLWNWFARRMGGGSRGLLNLGANRIHIHAETGVRVTFDDVAGAEEAKEELKEVIDFLKDPTRIQEPGRPHGQRRTAGRTAGHRQGLAARAVAAKCGVPFFGVERLRIRRVVRRRRRGARPRVVRAGTPRRRASSSSTETGRGRRRSRCRSAIRRARRARTDIEPAFVGDRRLRPVHRRRRHGRDQPARDPGQGLVARRPVRPADRRRQAGPGRSHGDPAPAYTPHENRRGGRSARRRAAHAGLRRCGPCQRRQRSGDPGRCAMDMRRSRWPISRRR